MKEPFGSGILDAAARLLAPFILVFALYVVFHGHDSPGGGFQGGTLLAAALMLLRLVRGRDARVGPGPRGALLLACAGAGLYVLIGAVAVAADRAFLDYSAFGRPRAELSFLVETGVGVGVAGVMLLIFETLAAEEE